VPVGFDLSAIPVSIDNLSSLRFRRDDKSAVSTSRRTSPVDSLYTNGNTKQKNNDTCMIDAAYLPLLAVLIPRWLETIKSSGKLNSRKIIFLISGRGTPRDNNSHVVDNSTKFTGLLMTKFIETVYPDIEIVHLHSTTNLFRYVSYIIQLNYIYFLINNYLIM
jgi:hypothetical protein